MKMKERKFKKEIEEEGVEGEKKMKVLKIGDKKVGLRMLWGMKKIRLSRIIERKNDIVEKREMKKRGLMDEERKRIEKRWMSEIEDIMKIEKNGKMIKIVKEKDKVDESWFERKGMEKKKKNLEEKKGKIDIIEKEGEIEIMEGEMKDLDERISKIEGIRIKEILKEKRWGKKMNGVIDKEKLEKNEVKMNNKKEKKNIEEKKKKKSERKMKESDRIEGKKINGNGRKSKDNKEGKRSKRNK